MTIDAGEGPRFGFGNLKDIEPDRPPQDLDRELRRVDEAADKMGFASRQAPARRRKRATVDEPTDQLNIRAAIADINSFVEWCEHQRFSYREGFAELVKKIA